jgi:integrase/recombinase XerD
LLMVLGSGWAFHRLRHTYATEMLRHGMPIENLKELLGHSRIQQTLAYAKIVPKDNEKHLRRVEAEFSKSLSRTAA